MITVASQFDPQDHAVEGKGTWTTEEHARFLAAIEIYPNGPWKQVAHMVGTRTVRQTQTHAQKYREKIARHQRGLRVKAAFESSHHHHQSYEHHDKAYALQPLPYDTTATSTATFHPFSANFDAEFDLLLDVLKDF
ncbi:Aste57867_18426 [Aphanomyces stellatus]|uniref:Aste57867_18426 protein n=1 Tax=Aphanomyces stellatus TaxID=120398 RepID=A0A485LAD9_9STRA|nr:hypothetical protein As57867_018364 [Aphanomyces stellatus]VFT95162.1 Aste57867_18426 [Aphanomyces stellatus]